MLRNLKLFLPLALLLVAALSYGQEEELFVYGVIKDVESLKKMNAVKVDVYQNGDVFDTFTTTSNGRYEFTMPLGFNYQIKFSSGEYVTKKVQFDTRNIPDEDKRGGFKSNMDMTLFGNVEGFDTSILDQPIGKASFNPIENSIDFDFDYTSRVQKLIDNEFERLDNLGDELAKLRENFEEEMEKGDQRMSGKKFSEAVTRFERAIGIAIDLTEADVDLAEAKRDEAQEKLDEQDALKDREERYNNLLAQGSNNIKKKNWEEAKQNYTDALDIKPEEQLPKDKLKEIERAMEGLADIEKYNELLASADDLFKTEDYALALDNYQEASDIQPDEKYPIDKIKETRKLLDEMLSGLADRKKMQERYDNLITLADRNFKDENYEDSRRSYEEASEIFDDERYPKDKMDEIDQILKDLANAANRDSAKAAENAEADLINKEYQALLDSANDKFDGNELTDARADYVAASDLKPTEKYPKGRIKRIDGMLATADLEAEEGDDGDDDEARRLADEAAENDRLAREGAADDDRKRRMAEELAEKERLAQEKARQDELDEDRRARFLNNVDASKEDEVERYYREARNSEQAAIAKALEKKKEDYEGWLAMKDEESRSSRNDSWLNANNSEDEMTRIHRDGELGRSDKINQKEKQKDDAQKDQSDDIQRADSKRNRNAEDAIESGKEAARVAQNDVHRDTHVRAIERKREDAISSERSNIKRGNALISDNEYEVNKTKKAEADRAHTGEEVRQDNITEVGKKGDRYQDQNLDLTAAAIERLEMAEDRTQRDKKVYTKIGDNAKGIRDDNAYSIEKAKREDRNFHGDKTAASETERFDRRKELFDVKTGQQRDVDDYVLTEDSADLPEGVTENSYQLNARTVVIERTVRVGNKVDNFRKVISKTGTYYFRNNSSITELMWKAETLNLGD